MGSIQKTEEPNYFQNEKSIHFATVCNNTSQPKKMWKELSTLMKKHHREPIQAISTNDGEVTCEQQMAEAFITGLFAGSDTQIDSSFTMKVCTQRGCFSLVELQLKTP